MISSLLRALLCATVLLLASCGGSDPLSSSSDITAGAQTAGPTPFIAYARLSGSYMPDVVEIRYVIAPKAGAASKAVDVTYTAAALSRAGYLSAANGSATLPVFGLYAGRTNAVTVTIKFIDDSRQQLVLSLVSPPYVDTNAVFDRPTLKKTLTAPNPIGFSFFYLKSRIGGPMVIDVDGEVRWTAPVATHAYSSAFIENGFFVGAPDSTRFQRIELDGRTTASSVVAPAYTAFHHNIDPGKTGWLAAFDAVDENGGPRIESIVTEIDASGAVLKEWNFATILGDYMRSQGDDPSLFIRPGIDWFHVNAATYDPRDDSIIASSRENFVIKVDYQSGRVIWILGDPTKYWYTFPSLRAKALQLQAGGLYPVGQHATSITSTGLLMLFNNGAPSFNQPPGAPVGESRPYSAVSSYTIDPVAMTAVETWRFDYGQTVLSDICSSAYEAPSGSMLINYAAADNRSKLRVVGLDAGRNVAFDFEYTSSVPCSSSWNAEPIKFDALNFR